ncbi:MAG: hypothetical protein LUF89_05060 [Ruminococcus sp.]|nr:hypothetical protein [Ruminococcus sp.]
MAENKTLKNKSAHNECNKPHTNIYQHKRSIGQSSFEAQQKVDIIEFYLTNDLADAEISREILRDKYKWKSKNGRLNSNKLLSLLLEKSGLTNSICFLRSDSIDETLVKMGFVDTKTLRAAKNDVVQRANLDICIDCPRGVLKWRYKTVITEDETVKYVYTSNSNSLQDEDETNKYHETMLSCLFRHIRNSFAHNNTYFFENGNVLFVDFDINKELSAMLLIKKQVLLEWRDLIIAGPPKDDEDEEQQ